LRVCGCDVRSSKAQEVRMAVKYHWEEWKALWYFMLIVWPFVAADGAMMGRRADLWQWQDFLAGLIVSVMLFGIGELVHFLNKRRRS